MTTLPTTSTDVTDREPRPMHLYDDLVDWYDLVDPVEDHADEAAVYRALLEGAVDGPATTLLELGCGAGNNAWHLAPRFRCTLTDCAPAMLERSRRQNPGSEHALGDMRTLRLGRTFDAVLVHDAICYMTTEDDLRAAARTAWEHTRPGGAVVFAPDFVRETFHEGTELIEGEDAPGSGGRALRGLAWVFDPDPTDTTYVVDYAFVLREGVTSRVVHDRHVEGLFPTSTWLEVLGSVGWEAEVSEHDLGDGLTGTLFVARRLR